MEPIFVASLKAVDDRLILGRLVVRIARVKEIWSKVIDRDEIAESLALGEIWRWEAVDRICIVASSGLGLDLRIECGKMQENLRLRTPII